MPSSSIICSSPTASPVCVTFTMERRGVYQPRTPLRSQPMAMGMNRSPMAMAVGVMNRSTDTMKSHLLNALYTR